MGASRFQQHRVIFTCIRDNPRHSTVCGLCVMTGVDHNIVIKHSQSMHSSPYQLGAFFSCCSNFPRISYQNLVFIFVVREKKSNNTPRISNYCIAHNYDVRRRVHRDHAAAAAAVAAAATAAAAAAATSAVEAAAAAVAAAPCSVLR